MSLIGDSKAQIILYLKQCGQSHGYEIAESLEITKAGTYQHLYELEDEGIVTSQTENYRRYYSLTEKGVKLTEVID